MEQPIKYSDLIQPDDSIDKLIQGLEAVNQQYGKLMEKIKSDAAQIVSSLQSVSGATEEGRRAAKESSTETDRLSKAYKQLEQAMDANAKEIARLNIAKRQMTNYQKMLVQRGQEEIRTIDQIKKASYQQLSAQYALNKAYINTLTTKERNIAKNKELVESTRQIYEQMKRLQEQTGKHQLNVGNYDGALKNLASTIGGTVLGVGSLSAAAMTFINTIKDVAAQGIELAKAGEGIRIAFERLNKPGLLDELNKATHNTVTNLELMKQAVKFNDFNLDLKQMGTFLAFAQQKAKDTGQSVDYMVDSIVTGLGRQSLMILDNLGISATEVRERMKQVGDMTTAVADIIRNRMSEAGDYVETAADRAAQAEKELKDAMEELGRTLLPLEQEGTQMWTALEIGAINLMNNGITVVTPALLELKGTISDIYDTITGSTAWDYYITALSTVASKAAEAIPVLGQLWKVIKALRGDGTDAAGGAAIGGVLQDITPTNDNKTKKPATPTKPKGNANKAEKEQIEAAKRRLEILRTYEDAYIELIEDGASKERAKLVVKYDRQIEDLRIRLETEKKLTIEERKNLNATIIAMEQQKAEALADLADKQAIEDMENRKKLYDAQHTNDNSLQSQLEALEKERQIEIAKNDLQKKGKIAEQAINAKYDAERLKLIQENAQKEIDLQNQLTELQIDNMEGSEYKKTQLRLQAEKDRIKKIYDLNVKAGKDLNSLEMQILREQMANIDKEMQNTTKNRDVFDLMGFNLNDDQKEAITQSFDFALGQLNDYMNAWVEAANRKVELADKEVESAQRTLDAEREARANGYASNVAYAQKELEMAKKNQEAALKEQEKAQKAKLAMDTIMQASNLISATALIFSQFGNPLVAIPMVSIMWGAFAAAKIKAMQMAGTGTEQYGEGTVELLEGGSHQSGRDVDLGRKKDGTRRRAEGGEFFAVINKRSSRLYRKEIPQVIKAFNNGTFQQKYGNAYSGADGGVIVSDSQSPDLTMLSDDVAAIREQGERRTYSDNAGTHIVYKNLHRIIKN